MNKWLIGILGFFVVSVIFLIGIVLYFVSVNNTAVRMEKEIEAQYKQNQNSRSQYVNKVMEAMQIPDAYKSDFKEVIKADMEGRYGKSGSKATFQWIKERELNFDSSLYTKLQNMIDAGRTQFGHEQQLLLDKIRVYKTILEKIPEKYILSMQGFPKINFDDFKIVTSQDNEEVFAKGVGGPLQLRKE